MRDAMRNRQNLLDLEKFRDRHLADRIRVWGRRLPVAEATMSAEGPIDSPNNASPSQPVEVPLGLRNRATSDIYVANSRATSLEVPVIVPFVANSGAAESQTSITDAIRLALARLLVDGLRRASAEDQVAILRQFPARRGTFRWTEELLLGSSDAALWLERSLQVRQLTNHDLAKRLAVSALATAITQRYNVEIAEIVSRGFLSPALLEIFIPDQVSLREHFDQSDNSDFRNLVLVGDTRGFSMPKNSVDAPSPAGKTVTFAELPKEEAIGLLAYTNKYAARPEYQNGAEFASSWKGLSDKQRREKFNKLKERTQALIGGMEPQ